MGDTSPWRLIDDSGLPGALNMARDVALLEQVSAAAAPPTVRLYGWAPPCLSLGRNQPETAADLEFCSRHGVDVVRRPTGGRAVLHHLELTYSVTAPVGRDGLPRAVQEIYRKLCAGLVLACRELGVEASLTPGEVNLALPGPRTAVPCFQAPAGGEVVVGRRKLIGSAMRVKSGVVLQHGAILLGWDGRLQAGAMGLLDDRELRAQVTTIEAELGRPPDRASVALAVVQGLETELGVSLTPGALTEAELAREHELASEYRPAAK